MIHGKRNCSQRRCALILVGSTKHSSSTPVLSLVALAVICQPWRESAWDWIFLFEFQVFAWKFGRFGQQSEETQQSSICDSRTTCRCVFQNIQGDVLCDVCQCVCMFVCHCVCVSVSACVYTSVISVPLRIFTLCKKINLSVT